MLFNIPDEDLSISESENAVCEGKVKCPIKSEFKQVDCCECDFNLTKYKVEGKNPIFQKVYDEYGFNKAQIKGKQIVFGQTIPITNVMKCFNDCVEAIKTYIEEGE